MNIYLDYAATTPISPEVKEVMINHFDTFGNPSSLHHLGVVAEKLIKQARKQVSDALGVNEREIIFTSGGTEANNLAIQGLTLNRTNARYITSQIEHPSVLGTFEWLEKNGADVVYLPVDEQGRVMLEALKSALSKETVLVSVMAVNNETGTIQPVQEIGTMIETFNREFQAQVRFHVDAVQAFGKFTLMPEKLNVDAMSISAHKIGGPKGIGALYVKKGINLKPLMFGGQQEQGLRPGTENGLGIMAFGKAAELAKNHMAQRESYVKEIKSTFIDDLMQEPEIIINGTVDAGASPYIINLSVMGVKGEVLLHTLEMKGLYVATGSACSSKKKVASHVLRAMKLNDARLEGAIRISFSHLTTIEEVKMATDILIESAKTLRSIMSSKHRKK